MHDLMFCEEDGLEYQKESKIFSCSEQGHTCHRPRAKAKDHGVAEGQET